MSFIARLMSLTLLSALPAPASAEPSFGTAAICRAAIASIADRNPKAVQLARTVGDVLFLTYLRPIDNFVWTYRCRIEDNRIIWASEPGRWRDGKKDDKVFFEVVGAGRQLRIIARHGDGSTTNQLFDRDAIF
jgi:hypothetical protein